MHHSLASASAVTCALILGLACSATAEAEVSSPQVRPSEVMSRTDAQLGQQPMTELPVHGTNAPADDRNLAPYFASPGDLDESVEHLPLKATNADVEIDGVIAHVKLKQTFENTGAKPIEAIYVFPASTRAAVHGMRMRIGNRVIEARIEKREEARQQYEAAKESGRRASLLEQQRPNVFTTQVANLMPGDRIDVELEYSELLVPEDSVYELVVPTVVGPRYGGGASPEKDQWIANPYLREGEKVPYTFDATVRLRTGITLKDVHSPSHPVDVAYDGQDTARVTLKDLNGGDRDFVLRYRLAGDRIETGVLLGQDERARYFTLIVEPPARVTTAQIVPREYIFVLDVSGSMGGFPLDTAKSLMTSLLGSLRSTDHFNVVLFSGTSATFSERSVPATQENVSNGLAFVDAARGGGGTELMGALQTAYALPAVGEGVSRSVVLVTDGFVGVEAQAFKFVRERLDSTNLFAFGIGSSVNRALIEGLARAGSGEPYVVLDANTAGAQAEAFRKAIDSPVLTDIRVRFHGFDAYEVAPSKQPDLMANRPLVVFGKYRGEATGEIEVTGMAARESFYTRISVASAAKRPSAEAVHWLWARKWVEVLEDQLALTQAKEVEEAITDLGLSYRLLTPFTSFVAIDSEIANREGTSTKVKQPLPLPKGVPNTAVGSAGLLGSLGSSSNVFGPGGLGTGINNAIGGMRGVGGLGARGAGPGGGGTGLGLGGLGGVAGHGRGGGSYGSVDLGGRGGDAPRVAPGKPSIKGGLDKDVIAKVVRRHRNELKYCYEQALSQHPELGGKVVLYFVIDSTGTVTEVAIAESSLKDESAQSCMVARVRRWKFPEPKGGGVVSVTYPWTFKPNQTAGAK